VLEELVGEIVVIDMRSSFVCLGTLRTVAPDMLELHDADLHDLRDTQTPRETYVAESVATGIKRNRKRVWVMRADIVAIARLADVVET
jgi:hypothetical protein